jgi:hypothetical protein
MNSTTVLLAAGQLMLAVAIGYIAWLGRRDARRSSLAALVTVLNELRNRNGAAVSEMLSRMESEDFKRGDDQMRSGLIDSGNRLRAIESEIAEALLCTLRQCDAEWGFAGRLHEAFRAEASFEKDWQKRASQRATH